MAIPPVVAFQFSQHADQSVRISTVKSLGGNPVCQCDHPPYLELLERQVVDQALDAIRFDPASWSKIPKRLQILKELELGDEHQFDPDLHKRIGKTLFSAFFSGELREVLHKTLDSAAGSETALVELRFDKNASDLNLYPWELLYDDDRKEFLFSSRRAVLVRYITWGASPPALPVAGRIKMLIVAPRPKDLNPLSEEEQEAILQGLEAPFENGLLTWEKLPRPGESTSTWEQLGQYLTRNSGENAPHILHFDGHGGFGRRCACGHLNPADAATCQRRYSNGSKCSQNLSERPQGYLAFSKQDGYADWMRGEDLANQLKNSGVRLVVLTACRSSVTGGGESIFSGVGPALIQAGIPAVVAMQYAITARAAREFARVFYLSLGEYKTIPQALCDAKVNLYPDITSWYRPVLYMRTDETNPEGRLYVPSTKQTGVVSREPKMVVTEQNSFVVLEPARPVLGRAEVEALLKKNADAFIPVSERFISLKKEPHFCVDQRESVVNFMSLLVPEWRRKPTQTILVVQAGKNQGKSTLLARFEYLCDSVRQVQPLLYFKSNLESRSFLAPDMLIDEIVDGLKRDAEKIGWTEKAKQIEDESEVITRKLSKDLSAEGKWMLLASNFDRFLDILSMNCRIVLLFDNFHGLFDEQTQAWSECSKWFLQHFLIHIRDRSEADLILTLTTEKGLEELVKWDQKVIYQTVVGDFGPDDLRDLFRLKFKRDLTDEHVKLIYEPFKQGRWTIEDLERISQIM